MTIIVHICVSDYDIPLPQYTSLITDVGLGQQFLSTFCTEKMFCSRIGMKELE